MGRFLLGLHRLDRQVLGGLVLGRQDLGHRHLDRDLIRTVTGWQVLGRLGGAEGREVAHYFDTEDEARAMLRRMLDTAPPEESDWAEMTAYKNRPR